MEKLSVKSYLLRFFACNLLSLVIWEGLFQILNFVTGGAVAIYSGMMVSSGYTPDDLSPTMLVVLPIILVLLSASVFFIFYVLMFFSIKRNKKHRGEFLRSIGGEAFDRKEFSEKFFKEGPGKEELICFIVLTAIAALSAYLYIPILSFVFQPQFVLTDCILLLFGLMKMSFLYTFPIPAIIMLIFNIITYYLYIRKIVPLIYEKWASERLRIDTNSSVQEQSSNV